MEVGSDSEISKLPFLKPSDKRNYLYENIYHLTPKVMKLGIKEN